MDHFETVGFRVSTPDDLHRLAELVIRSGHSYDAEGVVVHRHVSESGGGVVVVTDRETIACMKPAFAARTSARFQSATISHAPDCVHCDVVVLKTDAGMPLPVELAATAADRGRLGEAPLELAVSVIDEGHFAWWPDETTFRADETMWSVQSLVPLGMFKVDGEPEAAPSSARVLLHGRVERCERHRPAGGRPFLEIDVRTVEDLRLTVVTADPGHEVSIRPGAIVRAQGWAVADVLPRSIPASRPTRADAGRRLGTITLATPVGWRCTETIDLLDPDRSEPVVIVTRQSPIGSRWTARRAARRTVRQVRRRLDSYEVVASSPAPGLGHPDGWQLTHRFDDGAQVQHFLVAGSNLISATLTAADLDRVRWLAGQWLDYLDVEVVELEAGTRWLRGELMEGWTVRQVVRVAPGRGQDVEIRIEVRSLDGQANPDPSRDLDRVAVEQARVATKQGLSAVGPPSPTVVDGVPAIMSEFTRSGRGRSQTRKLVTAVVDDQQCRIELVMHGRDRGEARDAFQQVLDNLQLDRPRRHVPTAPPPDERAGDQPSPTPHPPIPPPPAIGELPPGLDGLGPHDPLPVPSRAAGRPPVETVQWQDPATAEWLGAGRWARPCLQVDALPGWVAASGLEVTAPGRWREDGGRLSFLDESPLTIIVRRIRPGAIDRHEEVDWLVELRMLYDRLLPPVEGVGGWQSAPWRPMDVERVDVAGSPAMLDRFSRWADGPAHGLQLTIDLGEPEALVVAVTAPWDRASAIEVIGDRIAGLVRPGSRADAGFETWVPSRSVVVESVSLINDTVDATATLERVAPDTDLEQWTSEVFARSPFLRDRTDLADRPVAVDGMGTGRLQRFDWQPMRSARRLTNVVTAVHGGLGLAVTMDGPLRADGAPLRSEIDQVIASLRVRPDDGAF